MDMYKSLKALFWGVILLLVCGVAQAATMKFDHVQVELEDQTSGQRLKGFSAAMKEMLVRISGQDVIVDEPVLAKLITAPSRYIKGYRYGGVSSNNLQRLDIQFNTQPLKELLLKNSLPVWPIPREEVLVWIAVREGNKQYIAKESSVSKFSDAVTAAAQRRGVPLVWPLTADIESGRVSRADITGGFARRVQEASKDYASQGILLVDVQKKRGDSWSAQWRLLQGEQESQWSSDNGELADVLNQGFAKVASVYAGKYAIVLGENQDSQLLSLQVQGIDSLDRYAQAKAYLQGVLATEDVQVVKLSTDRVIFQMSLNAGKAALERSIGLSRVMRIVPQEASAVNVEPVAAPESASDIPVDLHLELL